MADLVAGHGRQEALLYGLMGTSLLGALVTWLYRIETKGVGLEEIGKP